MTADQKPELTAEELAELEHRYDPEQAFRATGSTMTALLMVPLVGLALYQYYASGFGLIRELLHRGIFLAFMLGLLFLLFAWRKSPASAVVPKAWHRFDGVALIDIVLAILGVAAALYLPLLPPEEVARRVGNPSTLDVLFGTALLILVLEATRRSVGWTLPVIAIVFILFAIFGPYAPGALKHGGSSWLGLINHLYMTNQGIYGVAIGVMAQYVFLFILFGVLAMRIGLGQLFIDLAMALADRYSGGPAKVAIFSSAFMGTISGSSIANTVTTGALTIPAMKRIGYPAHFAGAVEATASTGGQITPPILGAAAFIMVEYLEIPLRDVLAAALFPALLHYFGIFIMVHLEARRLGLRGLSADELPRTTLVLRLGIAKALVPFIFVYSPSLLLVADGFTWAAFTVTLIGAMLGIGMLGAAFAGFLFAPLSRLTRWYIGLASMLFIAPGLVTMGIGLLLLSPVLLIQWRRRSESPTA